MKTITDADLQKLKDLLVADYELRLLRRPDDMSDISRKQLIEYEVNLVFNKGRKYIKVVSGREYGRSVIGFIVNSTDDKQFEYGALLKASSWRAPARNFARGSLFDLEKAQADGHIMWAGIS